MCILQTHMTKRSMQLPHAFLKCRRRWQAGVELPITGMADGVYNMTATLGPPYSAVAWVSFAKRSPSRRPVLEVSTLVFNGDSAANIRRIAQQQSERSRRATSQGPPMPGIFSVHALLHAVQGRPQRAAAMRRCDAIIRQRC
jgi:hypothetical protein